MLQGMKVEKVIPI